MRAFFIVPMLAFLFGFVCFSLQAQEGKKQDDKKADLLDLFAAPPKIAGLSLSPDGQYLAGFIRDAAQESASFLEDQKAIKTTAKNAGMTEGQEELSQDHALYLAIWSSERPAAPKRRLGFLRSDIEWMGWVGAHRLLLNHKKTGLILYQAKEHSLRPLIAEGEEQPDAFSAQILSPLIDDPDHVLLQWDDPKTPGYPAVYRVALPTGKVEKIVGAWRPVVRWYASSEGRVALGEGYEGRERQLYGRHASGGWHLIAKGDYFDDPALVPLYVEPGGATALILTGHASDSRALWRMNIQDGLWLRRVAGHERYDMEALVLNPANDLVIGASFISEEHVDTLWQPELAAESRMVAGEAGAEAAFLIGGSRDGKKRLYRLAHRQYPAWYGLYHGETQDLHIYGQPAFEKYPPIVKKAVWLPLEQEQSAKKLPPMQILISEPEEKNPNAQTPRPTLLLVHGGPLSRVDHDYDPLVHYLVARGYRVIAPDFRGSSGYGEQWRRAGYLGWGTVMQDDITATARWAIEQDLVRQGDICIFGGSFGGYAAQMALLRDYDLFRCGASLNGVSSLPDMIAAFALGRFSDLSLPRIKGDMSVRQLQLLSPLYRAREIRRPLLLLHGTEDGVINMSHSTQLAAILKKNGQPVTYIPLIGAGHSLGRGEHMRRYLSVLDDFFERNLGETPPPSAP